jgi:hypothetical protein
VPIALLFAPGKVVNTRANGGGQAKLQELSGPTISQTYKLTWEWDYLDLTELARLRWIEGWKIEKLANHFAVSPTAIKERLRLIKSDPKRAGSYSKLPVFNFK